MHATSIDQFIEQMRLLPKEYQHALIVLGTKDGQAWLVQTVPDEEWARYCKGYKGLLGVGESTRQVQIADVKEVESNIRIVFLA